MRDPRRGARAGGREPGGRGADRHLRHLEAWLREGGADFLAERATGVAPAHAYGRAHERQVWREFAREMHGRETIRNRVSSWGSEENHGAPDLGYWVVYRIAQAYCARAAVKRDAVRALLGLHDAPAILRASGYGDAFRQASVRDSDPRPRAASPAAQGCMRQQAPQLDACVGLPHDIVALPACPASRVSRRG